MNKRQSLKQKRDLRKLRRKKETRKKLNKAKHKNSNVGNWIKALKMLKMLDKKSKIKPII